MAIDFEKIRQQAPGLVPLAKTAQTTLEKQGLAGERLAVYLVLDHSGSMANYYDAGDVQRLADQSLALSTQLDDDGVVPVVFFASRPAPPLTVNLSSYLGVIGREHHRTPWGSTNYAEAMRAVTHLHMSSPDAQTPALVIFQTDGDPDSRRQAERALRELSSLPIFWAFVGFGHDLDFLAKLDDLDGREVDNASFFHAARPDRVTDAELFEGLTREVPAWLASARAAGILLPA